MDKEHFSEIELSAARNRSTKKWSFYIFLVLVAILNFDSYFRSVDNIQFGIEVFLIGMAFAWVIISYDREKKDLDKLNIFCLKEFGKEYELSGDEIISFKCKNNSPE